MSGHRGYYLTGDGVDLNQALISYGLDYLKTKGFKKVQPPFFMNKDQMAKTAQLDQFDEELYKASFCIIVYLICHQPDFCAGHRRGRRKISDCYLGTAHLRIPL